MSASGGSLETPREFEVLDHTSEGCCVIDRQMRILAWNRVLEEWSGCKASEMLGSVLTEHFDNLEEPRFRLRIDGVFSTGAPALFSSLITPRFLPFESPESPLFQQTAVHRIQPDEKGAPRVLITISDRTRETNRIEKYRKAKEDAQRGEAQERTRSERELAQKTTELEAALDRLGAKNRELDEFAYMASHDLQEPLRKLVGFTQLLEQDLGSELTEEAQTDLRFILDASKRMSKMIQDLMQLSRMGSRSLTLGHSSLERCVDVALENMRTTIEEASAQIQRDELPSLDIDVALVTTLYEHLISNAVKFSGEDPPRIHFTHERRDQVDIFGVADEGIGIEGGFESAIFDPFKRLHGMQDFEGTGIGLSVCRKAVERHGGLIWVERAKQGPGCHFRFTLVESDLVPDSTSA